MKIQKIFLGILIVICTIGIVAAADISDMKVANGYENLGSGSYDNLADSISIDIYDEGKNLKERFENRSDFNFTISTGKINDTFKFNDGINEMVGITEVVEIDGKPYAVDFWTDSNEKDIDLDKFYDALTEFNKLNNLTPINPSTLD
jgi:hypothetical protein